MLSKGERAEIIEALKANPNATGVARQVGGVSKVTVCRIAKQVRIELTAGRAAGGNQGIPPGKRLEIIEALKTNPHATTVANQFGDVSTTTVWNIAKRAGIELTAGKAARGKGVAFRQRSARKCPCPPK